MPHRQPWIRIRNALRGRVPGVAPVSTPAARGGRALRLAPAHCAIADRPVPAPDEPPDAADGELAATLLVLPAAAGFMLTGDPVLGILLAALAWLPLLLCCADPVLGWCCGRRRQTAPTGPAATRPIAGSPAQPAPAGPAGRAAVASRPGIERQPAAVVIATVRRSGDDGILWTRIVHYQLPRQHDAPTDGPPCAGASHDAHADRVGGIAVRAATGHPANARWFGQQRRCIPAPCSKESAMSNLSRNLSPLAVFAAALAAVFATMTGGNPVPSAGISAAADAPIAAAASDLQFIAGRFEDQKRDATGDELPPQF